MEIRRYTLSKYGNYNSNPLTSSKLIDILKTLPENTEIASDVSHDRNITRVEIFTDWFPDGRTLVLIT